MTAFYCTLQATATATTTTTAAASSDTPAPARSTNVAGIDLALLVDQLTRTGSSPEMTATILSTLVATSPDAGPEEQKQILQKLTEALRERQRQIEMQKLAAVNGSSAVSSSTPPSTATTTVATSQSAVSVCSAPPQSLSSSPVITRASVVKPYEPKPASTAIKETSTKPDESVFTKASSTTTTSIVSAVPSSAGAPSTQQRDSSIPCLAAAPFSSTTVSAFSTLSVGLATTSTSVIHPPATSALPPAIQQMLSGQSFENLKNILANVTARKTGGVGVQEQSNSSSAGSVVRTHETLDSYTTSKGSRSDLKKMVPEVEVQSKTSSEQDELFVANIHGDVDYRVRPSVPTDPPVSTQPPFSVGQSGWIGGNDQFPLPGSPTSQQPEGRYGSPGGTRSLLPGPFPQSSGHESKSSSTGPLLAMPLRDGKPQALLPTPESLKPSGQREERSRDNQEGRRQKSEDADTNRDRPRFKDRRPFDYRSSSRDDYRRRRSSRERSEVDRRSERRRSTDRSVTRKSVSSSRVSEQHNGTKVPQSDDAPIIILDDCEDIPLPPTTSASKSSDSTAPPAETSISRNQNYDTDRKVLLPTPDKQVSAREKRKSDEPRREQKYSRWEHRRPLKSSPTSSKAASETKGKKALLETPVASGSSESGRVPDPASAKDSRSAKRDSDSKSYDKRRSRSRSRARHIASNLLDRSRRKLGLRHHRSSSQDRRPSSSRTTAAVQDVHRRSRSKERPAPRSTSQDRLQEVEQRLRKQLDDLMARKNEGTGSKDNQLSPLYGQRSSEVPSLFNVIQGSGARTSGDGLLPILPRRHLLPAPHLVSANVKGRPLLEHPAVGRPVRAESGLMRPNVDRNRGGYYGQPADQPVLPSAAMLPGKTFVQEYSHKPAESHIDQFRYREGTGHIDNHKDSEASRPAFHEEHGQHRHRPYPVPEDRRRMPPESTERGRSRQVRERPNEEMDTSSKTSDFSEVNFSDRRSARIEKVGLPEGRVSEHSSPVFSAMDQSSATCQSTKVTVSASVSTTAKPELSVTGDGSLSLSSAPNTFSVGGNLVEQQGEQPPDTTMTPENEAVPAIPNVPCPPPPVPVPPYFPAFLQHVRNMMFQRGSARVPFNLMPGPHMRGMFRPPPGSFPMAPVSAPSVRPGPSPVMTPTNRTLAPLAGSNPEASLPGKKSLLGDYPNIKQPPTLTAEVMASINSSTDAGPESMQHQSEEMHGDDQVANTTCLMASPRLLETNQTQNLPSSQLLVDSATGEEDVEDLFQVDESTEQQDSGEIQPLMNFSMYRSRPLAPALKPPPQFGPPLMRGPPPDVRNRMPLPRRGMPRGLRVPRPMPPPALQSVIEMRGSSGPVNFPRHGGPPSFPPRGAPRHPRHQGASPAP